MQRIAARQLMLYLGRMKTARWLIFLWLSAIACSTAETRTESACQGKLVMGKYARGFTLNVCETQTEIEVQFKQGGVDTTLRFILNKRPDEAWPCATLSTTHLDFLEQIGVMAQVRATGAAEYTHNEAAVSRLRSGDMIDLSSSDSVDPEKLIASGSKIYFSYPFAPEAGIVRKAPGVTSIPVAEYLESHPLGRLEWIRFFGAIMGRSATADSLFGAAEARYLQAASSIRETVADSGRAEVLAFSVYNGQWSLPPGNSFLAQLVYDSGASYLLRDRHAAGNVIPNEEELFLLMQKADILLAIMPDGSTSSAQSMAGAFPVIKHSPAWLAGNVVVCNTKESDYFGKAVLEPDVLLNDLCLAFHPERQTFHVPGYFFRVPSQLGQ